MAVSEQDYGEVISAARYAVLDVTDTIEKVNRCLGKITISDTTSGDLIERLQSARRTIENVHKELIYAREIAYPRG